MHIPRTTKSPINKLLVCINSFHKSSSFSPNNVNVKTSLLFSISQIHSDFLSLNLFFLAITVEFYHLKQNMHLKRLCFIFPAAAVDSHGSKGGERAPPQPRCTGHLGKFVHRKLNKLAHSKWANFCHHQEGQENAFHDTEGVNLTKEEVGGGENPRIFSFSELYIGSKGFSNKEVLGSGGFGRVYRAVLPSDGTIVAVKCLKERGDRFEKTFMAELVAVAHLRHRNLVKLRGWCVHDDELLLVYDYMPNGSLDKLLFRKAENMSSGPLNWAARKKIIDGLGAALCYLHEQLEKQIIHRDVKASNVMLDSHLNARLGDFGLARWKEHELEYQPHTDTDSIKNVQFRLAETTRIGGTIGYLPPESFQKRGLATAKSDVFSFGVVMLEIVSGRRAIDLTYQDDQIILLDWARMLYDKGIVLKAGDNRLVDGSYSLSDMEKMLHLGLLCTLYDPKSRPHMKWTVDVLSGNIIGKLPNLPSFKSHPLYISLSSSGSNTSASYTFSTKSVNTTKIRTLSRPGLDSSNFVTAIGETVYVTAERNESSNDVSSSHASCNQLSTFPVVETPRVISYKEIIAATDNFSDSRRLAEVDFGTAYQGLLENKHHIVVKRLGMKTCPALRTRFSNELQNLGRLRHRNLVQLRGWCTEQGEMLVVYDYLPTRLLNYHLFHNKKSTLQWRYRYNIIKSLACAIRYLHDEWDEQVIHRNITSSAVAIDHEMNPRLGFFAIAEFLTHKEDGAPHVVVDKKKEKSVSGIFGYMSPEYMKSGEASTMADVYSFGIVVLEVVTGEMAVDFGRAEVLLVEKVHEFEEKRTSLEELADWRLDGVYNRVEMLRLIKLGIACTKSDAESRPSMKQAVSILNGYDHWLEDNIQQGEKREYWRQKNNCSLSIIRRIHCIGIN